MSKAKTAKKVAKKDEATVAITMPVGKDAGKQVKVTEKEAAQIKATFGEYVEGGVSATPDGTSGEVKKLKARIVELETLVVTVGEVGAAIDLLFEQAIGEAPDKGVSMLEKITELTELLSSEPEGGETKTGEAGDGEKEEGGDNG